MSSTAIFSESTPPADRPAEDHFPWDIEAAPSVVENDAWLLSFIDILTLLLALFVLLLAQEHQSNKAADVEPPVEAVHTASEIGLLPPAPLQQPFSAIRLPALPQIVAPVSRFRIPAPDRLPKQTETSLPPKPAKETTTAKDSVPVMPEPRTSERAIEAPDPSATAAHSRINNLLETLRNSELADRIDIQARTDSVRLDIAESILFAPARTRLTDSGLALLTELAGTLKALPWSLSVEGHTDNVPIQTARFPSNWELSTARATMVARELIRHGVRPDRIRAIGYADTRPRASNETAEGRNRNRRVTFVLELPENQRSSD